MFYNRDIPVSTEHQVLIHRNVLDERSALLDFLKDINVFLRGSNVCACACYVNFLKDISNFLQRSNLCVCAQAFFIFLPDQKEKLVHYFIALFFSARKSLTKYLVTDLDCQLTGYGLVFTKTMMKLLKSGVMRSVKQEIILVICFYM
jgi:hypothetical protein